MRKRAENPELIVDMFNRVTREHNSHGIDHAGTSKWIAWAGMGTLPRPDLDTKGAIRAIGQMSMSFSRMSIP